MSKTDTPGKQPTRKTVALPPSMWEEISEYRHNQRIATEAEAVRRLLFDALRNVARRGRT